VFVGWSLPTGDDAQQLSCAGSPEQIRQASADRALVLLCGALAEDDR
jgi:hypothetical protein